MDTPRLSLVHPTSNPFCRNAAIALAEINILQEIITTTVYNPEGILANLIKQLPNAIAKTINRELERRTWTAPKDVKISSHPWREVLRIALVKSNLSHQLGWHSLTSSDWIYTALDAHVAKYHLQGLDAIYAYEDGAATTFEAAKQQGIICLYDLPILFYRMAREIQQEEAEQFPELAASLQAVKEPGWKLERKEKEIELSDHIFVASSITQQSLLLEGISPQRISVIPYGAPIDYFQPQPKTDQTFRALFVGRVGARKGIHYLLKAWKEIKLPNSELMLVGVNELPDRWITNLPTQVCYIPSVPHTSLNHYYTNANVFIFPSLVEGFGLVLLEAMACGIPIITTPNTAGPDIITNGVEGFIVPIRDTEALKEKLEWCYTHPKALAVMGKAARQKAEQLTWERYRQTLATKVELLLQT